MKPIDDPKNWLPLKEAAHLLHLSRHTVVRLCDEIDPVSRRPFLCGWRPSPGTLLISRESLAAYCAATQSDPEFWHRRHKRIIVPSTPPSPASSGQKAQQSRNNCGRPPRKRSAPPN